MLWIDGQLAKLTRLDPSFHAIVLVWNGAEEMNRKPHISPIVVLNGTQRELPATRLATAKHRTYQTRTRRDTHKSARQSSAERVLASGVRSTCKELAWCVRQDGYDRNRELQTESRFTVSNGALGVRGSLEIPADISSPRTFVAGLYDLSSGDPSVPTLVSAPDWLRLELTVDGERVDLDQGKLLSLTRTLDLRHGVLWTDWHQRTSHGHTVRLRTLRFVSLVDRALGVQAARVEITPRRGTQPRVSLQALVPPSHSNLTPVAAGDDVAVWQTASTRHRLALASAPRLEIGGRARKPRAKESDHELKVRWEWTAKSGQAATLFRPVGIVGGRDVPDPVQAARDVVRRARRRGLHRLLEAHYQAWEARWAESDVEVRGDAYAQEALRFGVYHLNAAANPENEHLSIGARALTGDAYAGRIFWETEIYLVPFYVATQPAAARALLMYRYHTLPAARAKAERLGYRGAFYAWESADTGEEATPPVVFNIRHEPIMIYNATLEQHISADVAYAVWQYWQATGDDAFLREAGAEIILETARFWASRLEPGRDHRLHILHVIGPDEYHEGVDDNAYTNVMARWNLESATTVAEILASRWPDSWAELRQRLGITEEEIESWRKAAPRIVTGLDRDGRLIEQFRGYFELEPIFVAGYGPRTVPMDVILGPERTRRSQVVKQPDVLMLFTLLPYLFTEEQALENFRYYEERTGHGSSLSPSIHALLAAQLGEAEDAERYFHESAAIDLDDAMGNAAGGVHIGALAGLWQATIFGFAGLRTGLHGLTLSPRLPSTWQELRFPFQWRGRLARITCTRTTRHGTKQTVAVTLERGGPLRVRVGEAEHVLQRGERWIVPWPSADGADTEMIDSAA